MVIGLIKKALGVKEAPEAQDTVAGSPDLVGFVKYVVTQLVDDPDEIKINTEKNGDDLTIEVNCAKPDMGKVIGKRGKTIAAIRALVTSAARRDGKRVNVEVVD
ncbi:MAG: KH domain-containing protein [Lentisphaeria bacterium]